MEPEILRRGKQFHKQVQADWKETADGHVVVEKTTPLLPTGSRFLRKRTGRLDLFVDELSGYVVVVEIKSTNWDAVRPWNRHRLLGSHRRQVWRYMEKYLDGNGTNVYAGIIYPSAPSTPGIRQEVEDYLNDYGLQVVWYHD